MAQPEQLPQEVEPEALPNASGSTSKSTETRVCLASKIVNIRANQKGVSYKSLFGDYLRTAKTIKVVDPWVRLPHQIDNFVELVQVIREVSISFFLASSAITAYTPPALSRSSI